MDNTKKWSDILEELLQCCVCLDVPDNSTILQCSSGHLICNSCRKKLEHCPICDRPFIPTKCLLAEDIVSRIPDMKMRIAEEIMAKLQQREQRYVDTSTQTSFVIAAKCATTQTDDAYADEKKKIREITVYRCCMDSCALKLSYKQMIRHVTSCHKDMFYNICQEGEVISGSFAIDVGELPRNYDYALFANNVNLFFLQIKIHNNGQLMANLRVVDKNVATTLFRYRFLVTDGSCYLRRRGMVTSCLLQKETAYRHSVRIDEKEMSQLIPAKSIECTIIIKRCVHPIKIIDTRSNE